MQDKEIINISAELYGLLHGALYECGECGNVLVYNEIYHKCKSCGYSGAPRLSADYQHWIKIKARYDAWLRWQTIKEEKNDG